MKPCISEGTSAYLYN